ncbi:transposase [Vibrio aquimaris]|uniref:Transposase IS200 like protein n=1 Tax=Vibrio aquimaris TaxID=2587862 RepID=A0A5P9CJT3_9VIBR|nr:Transposase IS200 like protein [Vibrio aquimaris]
MKDHVHMCISVQLKYSVSNVFGYLKGKSAISIAKKFRGRQRNFNDEHFWAGGILYLQSVWMKKQRLNI